MNPQNRAWLAEALASQAILNSELLKAAVHFDLIPRDDAYRILGMAERDLSHDNPQRKTYLSLRKWLDTVLPPRPPAN